MLMVKYKFLGNWAFHMLIVAYTLKVRSYTVGFSIKIYHIIELCNR